MENTETIDTRGYVYFFVKTEDKNVDLQTFREHVSIEPTHFNKMFERGYSPATTSWRYSSEKLTNPILCDELEKLIEKLEPHKEGFQRMQTLYPDIVFGIEVVLFLGDESPALHFSRRVLDFVDYLRAAIDCDIYNGK